MASNITSAFIQQWSDDVKHAFQQKGSKLLDSIRQARNVTGSTYNFHALGTVTANTKTRDGDLTLLNPAQSVVACTLQDAYAPIEIDVLDELKTNIDFRTEMVKTSANALGRKVDDIIIAAAGAATNTTTTQTGGLTYAKLLEIVTFFNSNDVDPEDRVLVVGAKQLSEALNITQLTSSDYTTIRNVMSGGVESILGMKWIMSTRLANTNNHAAASVTTCLAFNKNAIGAAIGQDIQTRVDYVPLRAAHLINSSVSLGSTIIENAGITKMLCVE